jgi:outer membrane protein TolC
MKLPGHGRRTVFAALLLATCLTGCGSSRWARLSFRQPTTSKVDVDRHPTQSKGVDSDNERTPADSATRNSNRITQVAGDDDTVRVDSAVETTIGNVPDAEQRDFGVRQEPAVTNTVPLDLGSVLGLADGQNPQVGLARERISEAYAQVNRADVLWLPSLRVGANYNYHDGAIQDVAGNVINTTRNAFYGGFGAGNLGAGSPSVPGLVANFHLTDAIFQPKITRHQASSRQFAATATRNDILCDTAIAYLELLRAERRLAISIEAREKTNRIAELTEAYAKSGEGSVADYDRLLAELSARDNEVAQAEEAVQIASPRLAFLMHADPSVTLTANEPFVIPLEFTSIQTTTQELVGQGLSRRPELAEHRQLVCEACERLRREKFAPLIPSVLLGLSYGGFGGGLGTVAANTSDRVDADAIAFWEVRNLGYGEQAARGEAESRVRQARMREVVVLDRVAQEIVESHAQVQARRRRLEVSKPGIIAAERSYELNLQRIENAKGLPIEAIQSVQALSQARRDYLNAVIDHNIAQIRLCRATGWFEESNPTTATNARPDRSEP